MLGCIAKALVLSPCSKYNVSPLGATSLELVSGGSQSVIAETVLADHIEMIIKDQDGKAFKGANVKIVVSEGSISAAAAKLRYCGIFYTLELKVLLTPKRISIKIKKPANQ